MVPHPNSVAVIGLAGRFPGAPDTDTLWANLCSGKETITFYSDDELQDAGIDPALLADPGYVKAAATIDDPAMFDASFFGFSPKEAEYVDPQQRVFLECAQQALDNAGCDPTSYPGAIAIYGGSAISIYQMLLLFSNGRELRQSDSLRTLFVTGVSNDYLATRVSYKLRLRGAGLSVQTACSTSLVAVHLACQSLLSGECDVALAGGVSIQSSYGKAGYHYTEGGMVSPDGHCRPFDADANGTIFGDGAAIVVLKRLDRALADGDCVRAIVRGTAVNNDGADKIGFTAPSVSGQVAVIAEALAAAHVPADSVAYVEAHGTATMLGDPIEVAALSQVFGSPRGEPQRCLLGSLKGNIGHLNHASGVAGMIKVIMSLEGERIPGTLHVNIPNPRIGFETTPFRLSRETLPWLRCETPRRALINNFGIGGTNAHAVLEEAPVSVTQPSARAWHILPVCGKSRDAAAANLERLGAYLETLPDTNIADAALTLASGRAFHIHARAVVCQTAQDAATAIAEEDPRFIISGERRLPSSIAFMFPGQGTQRIGMGRALYDSEPAYRDALDQCSALLRPHLDCDLIQLLHGDDTAEAVAALTETRLAQPALFAVSYALSQMWIACGVVPDALIGHSIGELAAATIAGVFALEDALRIVAVRGQLMQAQPIGLMSVVPVSADLLEDRLPTTVEIAAYNAPDACVVSGPRHALEAFEMELRLDGIFCSRLRTSHAFHSAMMEPAAQAFATVVAEFHLHPPSIPFISNVTGTWITANEAVDPAYWGRQLRAPVRFADGIGALAARKLRLLLEVGPGRSNSMLARQVLAGRSEPVLVSTMPSPGVSEMENYARSLAQVWAAGGSVDLAGLYAGEKRRKVPLPGYQFQRSRFWAVPDGAAMRSAEAVQAPAGAPAIEDAVFVPGWTVAPRPPRVEPHGMWLIFDNGSSIVVELIQQLRDASARVVRVLPGETFETLGDDGFRLPPGNRADFDRLFSALQARDEWPNHVGYFWSSLPAEVPADVAALDLAFYGLVSLLQMLCQIGKPTSMAAITAGALNVLGDDVAQPIGALALGPVLAAMAEQNAFTARLVDLPSAVAQPERLASRLAVELAAEAVAPVLAYRGRQSWMAQYNKVKLADPDGLASAITPGSVWVLTGGMGDLGLTVAEGLAAIAPIKLVLAGRRGLPPADTWGEVCDAEPAGRTAQIIARIRRMEAQGAEVMTVAADAADFDAMRAMVEQVQARFGRITGLFHLAGIGGSGPMVLKDRPSMEAVLAPKVDGMLVIERLFRAEPMKLLVLFSSIAALSGGVGQADYTAGNAFMDAVANRPNCSFAERVLTINWDAWKEIGMAITTLLPSMVADAWLEKVEVIGISPAEGVRALHAILSDQHQQVLVSKRVLPPGVPGVVTGMVSLRDAMPSVKGQTNDDTTAVARYARPRLSTDFIAPRTELEEVLAQFWGETLNIEGIGVFDDFIELGGHSLLALQMIPKLRAHFKVDLSPRDIFGSLESLTVAEFARVVDLKLTQEIQALELPAESAAESQVAVA